MDKVNKLFAQYAALHRQGAQPDEIFAALRPEIEALSPKERLNLRSRVRAWRAGTIQAPRLTTLGKMMDDPAPRAPEGFTGLADVLAMEYEEAGAAPPAAAEAVPAGPDHTACPYCGVNNPADEVICQGCGHILAVNSPHATRSLAQTKEFFLNHEFFGSDYTLELRVRDTNQVYTLRPQDRAGGELVLGRNIAEGKALKVDVDLGDQDAEALGVSRLHLGLRYDTDYQTIQVYDVGSANGSFLDGQRLHRNERRILRDGDELRLGRLVMRVKFVRPA
jgi:hypothetical protein